MDSESVALRVISLNIRYDKPDPDDFNWRVRRSAIASFIKQHSPDLIGTQEGKAHQLLDLHRLLPEYQSIGGDRTGKGTDEHCAIFYNPKRLHCLKSEDYFLSETPEAPGSITISWGNPLPRMTTWGIFTLRETPIQIALCNTHLDYNSARSREKSADVICQYKSQKIPQKTYCFLSADFNDVPDSSPRQQFREVLRDTLENLPLNEQNTYHHFTGNATEPIDTIYYDPRVQLENVQIDRNNYDGVLISDHFPVIADFNIDAQV